MKMQAYFSGWHKFYEYLLDRDKSKAMETRRDSIRSLKIRYISTKLADAGAYLNKWHIDEPVACFQCDMVFNIADIIDNTLSYL